MTRNIEISKRFAKGCAIYGNCNAQKQRYIKSARTVLEKFSRQRVLLEDLPERLYDFKNKSAEIIRNVSEALADKTAQIGLFGEDADTPYSTTALDYIPEDAVEIRYINLDFLESGETGNKKQKNVNVLRVFNGF